MSFKIREHFTGILFILLTTFVISDAYGEVKLPNLFTDNMIIQRNTEIPVWGYSDPNEKINIQFKDKNYSTEADQNGYWSIKLAPSQEGGPYSIIINDIVINNVLVGDVWLCSGQSNIDLPIYRVEDLYKVLTDTLRRPNIRLLKVPNTTNIHDRSEDIGETVWRELSPENVSDFSAFSYFLAYDLYEKTGIPQGVIASSWGGTPIQSWIGQEYIKSYPNYKSELLLVKDDEYVDNINRAAQIANSKWNNLLYKLDKGVHEEWYSEDLDDNDWREVSQNNNREWTQTEFGPFNGSYWFRQKINIDKDYAGKEALLRLGCLVDADSTYVNGILVGSTGYQYPPRKYEIPKGLLKEGVNVITIRLIGGSNAEFVKDKPYKIVFEDKSELQLSEIWKFKHGAHLPLRNVQGIGMQNSPTACYNAMLYPLRKYPISGVLWYQGESNTSRPKEYQQLLENLMDNWRSIWKNETLPFFIVQLPNFMAPSYSPSESGWVTLRESQRRAVINDDNAQLVVGLGLGEWNDIHPLRKKELAERASLEIRKNIYIQDVITTPKVVKGQILDDMVILSFSDDIFGDENGEVYDLEISEDGRRFHNAKAVIKDNKLYISNSNIQHPVSVRYAWRNSPPNANLKGKNNLPLPTFQWDN